MMSSPNYKLFYMSKLQNCIFATPLAIPGRHCEDLRENGGTKQSIKTYKIQYVHGFLHPVFAGFPMTAGDAYEVQKIILQFPYMKQNI
jgi:hypothetical protein